MEKNGIAQLLVCSLLAGSLSAQLGVFRAETVATGLDLASAMAFAPDGRLFVTERTSGKVRVWQDGKLGGTWATIPVTAIANESHGLLGIAVDPGFLQNGFVYIAVASRKGTTESAIVRLQDKNGVGTNPTVIGPRAPTAKVHNIGPLVFGSDGKLYASMGDGLDAKAPQSLTDLRGKILRMDVPTGAVPRDNPHSNSYVWALGLRNAWGLAVHPRTGLLYATENGHRGADELDRIDRGANYGWPIHEGPEKTPDPKTVDPLWSWSPPIGPTGSCFHRGALYPSQFRDGWFLADVNNGHVLHAAFDATGAKITKVTAVHDYAKAVFGVVSGPDGDLYVLYSTASGRGGDRIDRLVYPRAAQPGLTIGATSNVAVGGSLSIGVQARTGSAVLVWVGARRFAGPVTTPFGDWWVPGDIVLPSTSVRSDHRIVLGFTLPKDPKLTGKTIHVQAAAGGPTPRLTNADAWTLR